MSAIAVFVKTPGLSPVKTRLSKEIGCRAAAEFHLRSAQTVAAVIKAAGPGLLPYWAVAEQNAPPGIWTDFPMVWQGPGYLGDRMGRIYGELLRRHGNVLLVGADAPQISAPAHVAGGIKRPSPGKIDFVLNPASDGGFWLLGGRTPITPTIWGNVPYSHPETGTRMLQALRTIGAVETGPVLADVDTKSDLSKLLAYLEEMHTIIPAQVELRRHLRTMDSLRPSLTAVRDVLRFQ